MRFHAALDDILGTPTAVRLLRAWTESPHRTFTGRELAAQASVHPNRAHAVLRRLEEAGLAERRVIGRAHAWSLLTDHHLVRPLQRLFDEERKAGEALAGRVRAVLEKVPGVRRVVLFGSVARGDERPWSDLDLLVVVDSAATKAGVWGPVHELSREFAATFGNPLMPVIYTASEYERKRGLPLVKNIEREGRLLLGEEP